MVKQVQGFLTESGRYFNDPKEAFANEAEVTIEEALSMAFTFDDIQTILGLVKAMPQPFFVLATLAKNGYFEALPVAPPLPQDPSHIPETPVDTVKERLGRIKEMLESPFDPMVADLDTSDVDSDTEEVTGVFMGDWDDEVDAGDEDYSTDTVAANQTMENVSEGTGYSTVIEDPEIDKIINTARPKGIDPTKSLDVRSNVDVRNVGNDPLRAEKEIQRRGQKLRARSGRSNA